MPPGAGDEPLLTLDQAYVAAWYFISQFYERDGRKPESMFFLLRWMELAGHQSSVDPAQWEDWLASVDVALDHEIGESHFPTVSEPKS